MPGAVIDVEEIQPDRGLANLHLAGARIADLDPFPFQDFWPAVFVESDRVRHAIPSFFLMSSLTACGLALPPVAFITWPTNQPASAGLALACSALSGLAAMTSSTAFSIAPRSVT